MKMTRDQYIRWFQTTLRDLCDQAGITMKLEETWVSTTLLEYGREYYYKGAQVSSALKRISRISSEANQTIPSLNSDLAGIISTGMAAAQKDHLPIPVFWVSINEAAFTLFERHPSYKNRSTEFMTSLLSTSRVLGGYPITLFSNFCTRSVQDPLTTNLHLARTLLSSPRHRSEILKVATTLTKNPDPKMLIKDPQSLPLNLPRQPENYLKRKIAEGLPSLIKNRELLPLFGQEIENQKTNLINDLLRITPHNPKLMSKLMALSNVGKQEAMINKFSSTRSIQAVLCREWNSEIEVLRDIRSMEESMLEHMLGRQTDPNLYMVTPETCLTHLAQKLRETSWGMKLEGITMTAQQEQATVCRWEDVSVQDTRRAISLQLCGDKTLNWATTRGPKTPYIGAPTRVRAKRQPLQETESYSYNQSLIQALQLRSWVKGDISMTTLLDNIIREKSEASQEELDRRTAHVYSGTITHRLPCPTMSRGGQSNSTCNFASHISICSSTASDFAKKGEDYTICFQSVFLYGIATLNIYYHKFGSLPENMAIVLHSGCCIWEIPPEVFSLTVPTYAGVIIPSAMTVLPDTTQEDLPYTPRTADLTRSYAGHIAYKFAIWVLNRKDTNVISTLERRAMDETTTPPFINLSEFSRIDLEDFFNMFVVFLLIIDNTTARNPHVVLNEIRKSLTRTGFDDLIDSITLGGLTHVFCEITSSSVEDISTREQWRLILADYLLTMFSKPTVRTLIDHGLLLPDESGYLLRRWLRTLAHQMRIPTGHMGNDRQSLVRLIDDLNRRLRNTSIVLHLPDLALSEDESVAGTRRQPRKIHKALRKIPLPSLPAPQQCKDSPMREVLEEYSRCISGGRLVNQIYEILIKLSPLLNKADRDSLYLITCEDPQGQIYSLFCHMFPGIIKTGFPCWSTRSEDGQQTLETGPLFVTGDPCTINYEYAVFVANLGITGLRFREDPSTIPFIVSCKKGTYPRLVDAPEIGFFLTQNVLSRDLGGWHMTHTFEFQKLQSQPETTWHLYVGGMSKPVETHHIATGSEEFGRALRRPFEVASLMTTMRVRCFSPLSSVIHLLRGNPIDKQDLVDKAMDVMGDIFNRLPDKVTEDAGSHTDVIILRAASVRSELIDHLAALGLLVSLAITWCNREPHREGSYFKLHIHYHNCSPISMCQRRCKHNRDRGPTMTRSYTSYRMRKWWTPSILMVSGLGGKVNDRDDVIKAFISYLD